MKEVEQPESVINGKIIRFPREVPFMIYEDKMGAIHIDREFREGNVIFVDFPRLSEHREKQQDV